MKRLHIHITVKDIEQSVQFYSTLFNNAPTVSKPDYAKWMLDDPRVNFAISTHGQNAGLDHLGMQVDSSAELSDITTRLETADREILDAGETTCCYARSDKAWVKDPQGIAWESFYTLGETTEYGVNAAMGNDKDPANGACCGPAASQCC